MPIGANHSPAHLYADGSGVRIGIIETVAIGIYPDNHLGDRLQEQYDFRDLVPSDSPTLISEPNDPHESLIANIAAGANATYPGVAPAATIYDAAINGMESMRAAMGWLQTQHVIDVYNLSFQFGQNDNGANLQARYIDWFAKDKDVVIVVAAGNFGEPIMLPADNYNGITVGAMLETDQTRWTSSSYRLHGGDTEVRGKPEILAPGRHLQDGVSVSVPISGTSFAAPHVAGTSALLKQYAADDLGTDLHHLGTKALILNSARKRNAVLPEVNVPSSNDTASAHSTFDKDYLDTSLPIVGIANSIGAPLTDAWTPSAWTYDGSLFSATKPLDDEQGVGILDATRAIVNLAGGSQAAGTVSGIGWNEDLFTPGGNSVAGLFAIDQAIPSGGFVTATLAWDRIVTETDGDGIVEDNDTYSILELANFDLRLVDGSDQIVAQSISTTDNLEHLHVPVPELGLPGDYKLEVYYSGGASLATDFALAWWVSQDPFLPGDYNLDGVVDLLDYSKWRDYYGASTLTMPLIYGDGTADGLVDARDYTVWRDNVGLSWMDLEAAAAATAAVPEPATLSLAGLVIAWIGLCRLPLRSTMPSRI